MTEHTYPDRYPPEPRGCPTPGACSAVKEIERLRTAKLWLWRNGDHFLAFDNPCPTYGGGDPMTLGEPVGIAILTPSTPGWERWDEDGKPIPSANRA